jgi:PASTA domain
MSDERDERRPFTPRPGDDDATRIGGSPGADDETRLSRPFDDETRVDRLSDEGTRVDRPSADETRVDRPSADETRVDRPFDDETRVDRLSDDETRVDRPSEDETVVDPLAPGANPTSVMPPASEDWARSRANPAWSGRAEVRAPRPDTYQQVDEWPETMGREPRDRWWMPIVVGIVALILLAALAFGLYLIVQNSGDETPAPAPPASPAVAPTQTTTFTPSTPPSTEPTTTAPSPTPSTTNPTTDAVTIPALKGLPREEAETALSNMGLRWHVILHDGDALPGTVIDSDPAEGQEVPPDTRITLVVAEGATPPATGPTGSSEEPGLNGD